MIARVGENAIRALEAIRKAIEGMKRWTRSRVRRRTDRAMEALSLISTGVGLMKSILDCLYRGRRGPIPTGFPSPSWK